MGSMWLDPDEVAQLPIELREPGDFDPALVNHAARGFKPRSWGSDYRAMLSLAEFATTDWKRIRIDPYPTLEYAISTELPILVDYQKSDRAARLPEILAQDQNSQNYLVAALGISRRSHPQFYLALKMAARAGDLVMAYLKVRRGRARPSQLYPPLQPPLGLPLHASYPSGHALISHLLAFTAIEIATELDPAAGKVAQRISENREIAGLHFPSDTVAGVQAAVQAFDLLMDSSKCRWFWDTLEAARREWKA